MPTPLAPLGISADFATLANLFAAAQFTDATRLYAFASDGLPETGCAGCVAACIGCCPCPGLSP